jgi:hypothetical protein
MRIEVTSEVKVNNVLGNVDINRRTPPGTKTVVASERCIDFFGRLVNANEVNDFFPSSAIYPLRVAAYSRPDWFR